MRAPFLRVRLLVIAVALWVPSLGAQEPAVDPTATEALRQRLETTSGAERIPLLVELLRLEIEASAFHTALALGDEALTLLAEHPDPRAELAVRVHLTEEHGRLRNLELALEHAARAQVLARDLGDDHALARVLKRLADVERYRSDLGRALPLYGEARRLAETVDDPVLLGDILNNTGVSYLGLDDLPQALRHLLQARQLFEQIGDRFGVSLTSASIAEIYDRLGQPEPAQRFFAESIEVARSTGIRPAIANALTTAGSFHLGRNAPETALRLLREAERLMQETPEAFRSRRPHLENLLGDALSLLGDETRALEHFRQALRLVEGEPWGARERIEARQKTATLLARRGDLGEARRLLEAAVADAEIGEHRDLAREGLVHLTGLQAEQGDHAAALTTLRRRIELQGEAYGRESQRTLAELRTRFEVEQNQREIALLRADKDLQAEELERRRGRRNGLVVGFGLFVALLASSFQRYRLVERSARLQSDTERQRAVNAQLRKIDRMKDEFLANTAHELRTPLYGIVGLAESLSEETEGLPPSTQAGLRTLAEGGQRLGSLVSELLDLSKLRGRQLELDLEAVDLRALVDVVTTLVRPLARHKGLELIHAIEPTLPPVEADARRLRKVLHHLVHNAVKFTDSGRVEVGARRDGERIEVAVHDTGMGIEEDAYATLFEAFSQTEGRHRSPGGVGLGLAICQRLVALHGSSLEVTSRPGEGSSFRFDLAVAQQPPSRPVLRADIVAALELEASPTATGRSPSANPAASEPDFTVSQATGPQTTGPRTTGPLTSAVDPPTPADEVASDRGHTLLAVDDDPLVRQVLAHHLRPADYRVIAVADGIEALAVLERETIDLVLLDVMMPQMSGFEVCRAIRENRSPEELPVLFLSATDPIQDRVVGLDLGGNDFLVKPIARDELLARVRTHLELLEAHRSRHREIATLEGLLPICCVCKKVREDDQGWVPIPDYLERRSHRDTAVLCGDCTSGSRV